MAPAAADQWRYVAAWQGVRKDGVTEGRGQTFNINFGRQGRDNLFFLFALATVVTGCRNVMCHKKALRRSRRRADSHPFEHCPHPGPLPEGEGTEEVGATRRQLNFSGWVPRQSKPISDASSLFSSKAPYPHIRADCGQAVKAVTPREPGPATWQPQRHGGGRGELATGAGGRTQRQLMGGGIVALFPTRLCYRAVGKMLGKPTSPYLSSRNTGRETTRAADRP